MSEPPSPTHTDSASAAGSAPHVDPVKLACICTFKLNNEKSEPTFDLRRLVLVQNLLQSIYTAWAAVLDNPHELELVQRAVESGYLWTIENGGSFSDDPLAAEAQEVAPGHDIRGYQTYTEELSPEDEMALLEEDPAFQPMRPQRRHALQYDSLPHEDSGRFNSSLVRDDEDEEDVEDEQEAVLAVDVHEDDNDDLISYTGAEPVGTLASDGSDNILLSSPTVQDEVIEEVVADNKKARKSEEDSNTRDSGYSSGEDEEGSPSSSKKSPADVKGSSAQSQTVPIPPPAPAAQPVAAPPVPVPEKEPSVVSATTSTAPPPKPTASETSSSQPPRVEHRPPSPSRTMRMALKSVFGGQSSSSSSSQADASPPTPTPRLLFSSRKPNPPKQQSQQVSPVSPTSPQQRSWRDKDTLPPIPADSQALPESPPRPRTSPILAPARKSSLENLKRQRLLQQQQQHQQPQEQSLLDMLPAHQPASLDPDSLLLEVLAAASDSSILASLMPSPSGSPIPSEAPTPEPELTTESAPPTPSPTPSTMSAPPPPTEDDAVTGVSAYEDDGRSSPLGRRKRGAFLQKRPSFDRLKGWLPSLFSGGGNAKEDPVEPQPQQASPPRRTPSKPEKESSPPRLSMFGMYKPKSPSPPRSANNSTGPQPTTAPTAAATHSQFTKVKSSASLSGRYSPEPMESVLIPSSIARDPPPKPFAPAPPPPTATSAQGPPHTRTLPRRRSSLSRPAPWSLDPFENTAYMPAVPADLIARRRSNVPSSVGFFEDVMDAIDGGGSSGDEFSSSRPTSMCSTTLSALDFLRAQGGRPYVVRMDDGGSVVSDEGRKMPITGGELKMLWGSALFED
ncbi:hypothetical protein BJ742DRAFT_544598 [Cladochytrium replicatum]|nr:hypothetical protein BJ742DRAFT_544598 [Cladochytrium replicatum]